MNIIEGYRCHQWRIIEIQQLTSPRLLQHCARRHFLGSVRRRQEDRLPSLELNRSSFTNNNQHQDHKSEIDQICTPNDIFLLLCHFLILITFVGFSVSFSPVESSSSTNFILLVFSSNRALASTKSEVNSSSSFCSFAISVTNCFP